MIFCSNSKRYFNPRTPCGVRRKDISAIANIQKFQSTHPLRGATMTTRAIPSVNGFQSTHPLRGATHAAVRRGLAALHFNPRTPCGVRQDLFQVLNDKFFISIHAPLAGCDQDWINHFVDNYISIHAPLAGCDRLTEMGIPTQTGFQSTHPLRGATEKDPSTLYITAISIHAPLAGCDCRAHGCHARRDHFNPRTPCGVRLLRMCQAVYIVNFNPRTPCGVRRRAGLYARAYRYFNPRTPCGVRPG